MRDKLLFFSMLGMLNFGVLFGMSIDESVQIALKNNPDIKKVQLNQKVGDLSLKEHQAKNYGKINVIASYTHYNLPRTLVPLTPASIFVDPTAVATTKDLFSGGLVYDVALFSGFAQKSDVEISSIQKLMSESMLKLSREELIYNIRSIYINILSLKSQLSSQQEYIKALQSLQKSVKMEVDLGKKSTLELLKVQVSLQEAKGNEIKISSSITSLKASLISLMGVESIDGFEDVEVELKDTPSDTKKLSSLERFHISSLMVEKTKKGIKKANATYYPQLNLNAYYGQNLGPNDDTNTNEGDWHNEEVWQAGVNLKWNLFDFGSKSAVSQKAEIAKLQAKLDDTKTKLEFKKLITQANSQIESSKQNYESLKAQYRLSKESQKIEQIRFDNGVSDINDLLLSKAKTQLALSQMINAKYQYKLQTYYLDYLFEDGDKR